MRFDYECQNADCQFSFEVEQTLKARRLRKCKVCGKTTLERVILEAPLGFVQGEPTTVGQLAERNTKSMGVYGIEEARRQQREAKIASRKEAVKDLLKKMPEGTRIPDYQESKPWYGRLTADKKKAIESGGDKQHKYIMTGE